MFFSPSGLEWFLYNCCSSNRMAKICLNYVEDAHVSGKFQAEDSACLFSEMMRHRVAHLGGLGPKYSFLSVMPPSRQGAGLCLPVAPPSSLIAAQLASLQVLGPKVCGSRRGASGFGRQFRTQSGSPRCSWLSWSSLAV